MVAVRKTDAGFTLTELMVVVVILALLAAVSSPLFTRDNNARKGRGWANIVAQTLQRARFQAMGDHANIHVLLYRTRIELYRQEPAGAAAPFLLLTTLAGPIADADKTVAIWDARTTGPTNPPPGQNTTLADTTVVVNAANVQAIKEIIFTSLGSTPSNDNWRIYIRNELLPSAHPDSSFVINIGGLTGFISSNDKVTLP